MGHYRSEMVSGEEQERERREQEARLQRKAKVIEERINEKGLAYVLAEMNQTFGGRIF